MTRKTSYVTAIAAATFCLLVAPANATHVQCGDTITISTVLDSDVVCGAGEPYGLIIGANDIVLNLSGYTVRGVSDGNRAGIYNPGLPGSPGPANVHVRVKAGRIEGFDYGVQMGASDSTLHRLRISTPIGVRVHGDRNTLSESEFIGTETYAASLGGDDPYLWGNRYTSTDAAGGSYVFLAAGNRSRVVNNHVVCQTAPCFDGGVPAINAGYPNAFVNANTVVGDYAWGIYVESTLARVTRNESIGNFTGIQVAGQGSLVGGNVANNFGPLVDQFSTGIAIFGPGVTVRNNTANDNSGYGIYAVRGTIDGGGNTASGNGQGDTAQCWNIQCGPSR
ncbi:MAG TPA: hypothetical protein VFB51_03685 [Solirubrobacterales bacterium]|nr:hypothetical protein [Solirubrobacterales bacterium]